MDHKAQRNIIQKILLGEWDPIGVSDIAEAQDEYDTYADAVSGMLTNRAASVDDIAQYLFNVVTEQMGLSYPQLAQRCEKAATAVAALQSDQ